MLFSYYTVTAALILFSFGYLLWVLALPATQRPGKLYTYTAHAAALIRSIHMACPPFALGAAGLPLVSFVPSPVLHGLQTLVDHTRVVCIGAPEVC
jgi:hypothetical protein